MFGEEARPPRVALTTIARPVLLRRLSSWGDISLVHGPTGSGKTTLLASWASSVASSVFWCEPEDQRLPFSQIRRFVLNGGELVVVDCGERVSDDDLRQLGLMIDRVPNLRVVIAARNARVYRELAASSDAAIDVIGPKDLLLTLQELRDADLFDDETSRADVLNRTGGLAIAVRAELENARNGASDVRERLRRRLHAELDELPGAYEAAKKISLFPRVDDAVLEAWEIPDALSLELESLGILSRNGGWSHMSPYLADTLFDEAARLMPREERAALVESAIRASLLRSDPLQALHAAFDIGDFALATDVVLANMVEFLESREESYALFQGVARSRLYGYPALTVTFALLSNMDPTTRPRALRMLATESLFQRLRPSRSPLRERVLYRAFEAAALRLTPFSQRAAPLIGRALQEFLDLPSEDHETLGRMGPMVLVHLGIGAFYAGKPQVARQCFELAEAKHVEAGRDDRVDPLSLRGGLAALSGDLPLARSLLAQADAADWPPRWRDSSPADFLNLGMAVLALEDGDPIAAETHLAQAGPIADIVEHWTLFALVRARRDLLAGEAEVGLMRLRLLRTQRGASPGTALAKSLLDVAEAELRLGLEQPDAARKVLANAPKHSITARIALGRVELALGRSTEAIMQAKRVLQQPEAMLREHLEAELVLVCAALRLGRHDDVVPSVQRIIEILRTTGMRAPLRTVAPEDGDPLVREIARNGADPSLVEAIRAELASTNHRLAPPTLTRRERAVLHAFTEADTVEEVAKRLFVSSNTVKSHLRSAYHKLGVSSRADAIRRAALLGFLDDPSSLP